MNFLRSGLQLDKVLNSIRTIPLGLLFIIMGLSYLVRPSATGVIAAIDASGFISSEAFSLGMVVFGLWILSTIFTSHRLNFIQILPFSIYTAVLTHLVISTPSYPVHPLGVYWFCFIGMVISVIEDKARE